MYDRVFWRHPNVAANEAGKLMPQAFLLDRRGFLAGSVAMGVFAPGQCAGGAIHGSQLGLADDPGLDQFAALQNAIRQCSAQRVALDITGLEIRVATQANVDPKYLYVGGRRGSRPTYGIYLGPGTWLRIVGEGTIGNLEQDSRQYLFHAVDAEYIEIGDGVTLDGNKTLTRSGGGTCHFMGVKHVHLGAATFWRDGIVRLGSSPNGMTGLCTFTTPRFIDCRGTHCIGGKPGGCREWRGDTIYVNGALGGLSLEAEDQNGFNDDGQGGGRWPDKITAKIGAVVCENLNGIIGGARTHVHAVAVSDGEGSEVEIGSIVLRGGWSPTGTADALVVSGGQSDRPAALVRVGRIHVENAGQVVSYVPSLRAQETIEIGSITGSGVDELLVLRPLGGGRRKVPYGRAKRIRIERVEFGSVLRRGLAVENKSRFRGPLIDRLEIGEYRAREPDARSALAAIRDNVESLDLGPARARVP